MRSVPDSLKRGGVLGWLAALALVVVSSSAFAFGSASRFVIIDSESSAFSRTGTWTTQAPPPPSNLSNPTFFGEAYYYVSGTGGAAADATARWEFGTIVPSPGSYQFDAFIPDDNVATTTTADYRLESAPFSFISGCGAYSLHTQFGPVNQSNREGNWANIGTATLAAGPCYRLVLTNANTSARVTANAARAERLFESSATITDLPRLATAFAAGTTNITSSSNAVPTIITTLTVTCPQIGMVVVNGSGESAAQTNVAGTNFNGLAYSISKNSTATDNSNVVQSSSLATFNGDANRDFLSVQRTDNCTAGESITYRLTGYRSQAATGPASFIWNGRLVGQYFATGF